MQVAGWEQLAAPGFPLNPPNPVNPSTIFPPWLSIAQLHHQQWSYSWPLFPVNTSTTAIFPRILLLNFIHQYSWLLFPIPVNPNTTIFPAQQIHPPQAHWNRILLPSFNQQNYRMIQSNFDLNISYQITSSFPLVDFWDILRFDIILGGMLSKDILNQNRRFCHLWAIFCEGPFLSLKSVFFCRFTYAYDHTERK